MAKEITEKEFEKLEAIQRFAAKELKGSTEIYEKRVDELKRVAEQSARNYIMANVEKCAADVRRAQRNMEHDLGYYYGIRTMLHALGIDDRFEWLYD